MEFLDPQFLHDGNCLRAHLAGLRSGALDLEATAGIMPQQPFRHLAPGRIPCAQNEHSFLSHYCCLVVLFTTSIPRL